MNNIFLDIGIVIILSTLGAFILRLLKQPMIPAYIIVGVLLGPVLGLLTDLSVLETLSEIGIAFLLFIVGLELDLRKLRDIGNVASVGAVVQMLILFFSGYFISLLIGYDSITGVYFGFILAFSSTMVVIKLLSDKHELETLHGRIIIGILLMQDVIAVLAITVLKDINNFSLSPFILSIAQGVGLLVIAILLGKYFFPFVFKFAAKHQELLFLASLSVCFIFSLLFSLAGFSIAIGAFVAGVALGNLPYNIEIVGRIKPLRDFFSVMFFTAIGAEMILVDFSNILAPFLIFTLFTVLLSPIIISFIVILFGYKARTSFLTGISLAQISEFSLIIASQGLLLGHISREVFSLTVLLALVTLTITSYFINYDDFLYETFGRFFKPFEKLAPVRKEFEKIREDHGHEYILVGMDRIGYSIFRKLRKLGKDFVVVDFNPDIIKRLISKQVPCIYGDISDPEILEKLKLHHAKMLISTIPNLKENLFIIKQLKKRNANASVIVTSYQIDEALQLYDAGADYVIIPHYLGGEHVSVLLEDISKNLDKLINTKLEHIRDLRHRQSLHPHHR